jgi:hypothetical protein
MGFDHGFIDAPHDTAEGDAEQAAHHQRSLDVLYTLGNQYMVSDAHMQELCNVAGISFEELCKYKGKS